MNVIQGRSLTTVFYRALEALMGPQAAQVPSRIGDTKELHPFAAVIENPVHRYLLVPGRKNSLAATIFETMWVASGQDKLDMLTKFLPRAVDYSDDGKTWRGAYGPRIRKWVRQEALGHPMGTVTKTVDQLTECYKQLKANHDTRQAVMVIYDPGRDTGVVTKDVPCNNMVYFLVRDGKLDMTVTVRSNDCFWGFSGINVFEWTFIQELMACWLDIPVGKYIHQVNSFHIYDYHWDEALNILAQEQKWWDVNTNLDTTPDTKPMVLKRVNGPSGFYSVCSAFQRGVELAFQYLETPDRVLFEQLDELTLELGDSKIGDYFKVVVAHILLKEYPLIAARNLSELRPYSELKTAALIQANRRVPGFVATHWPEDERQQKLVEVLS